MLKLRTQIHKLILAVSASCACVCARGDEGNYLTMELDQLLQVPVTGSTLRDESLKTVPAAVTIFTHDQLEKLGQDYLYELLNLVPGYQSTRAADHGANYTFSSRGRRNSAQAREILVVMDGRILANPRTGSVDVSLPLIPLEQIERIEIIRGPGSAIYGSSAFTGVINIVTRKGQNAVKVEVGNDQRKGVSLMLSKPVNDWTTNLFARAYEDSGQIYNVPDSFTRQPTTIEDPRKTFDLDLALGKDETQLRVAYHRFTADDFYSLENNQSNFNGITVWLKQISLEQGIHFVDGVTTQIYAGYLANSQSFNVATMGAGSLAAISNPSSDAPLLTQATLAGESYNLRLTNTWDIGKNADALLGVEWKHEAEIDAYVHDNFDSGQLAQKQFPINYYGNFDHVTQIGTEESYNVVGIYGQYHRTFGENTNLTLGARYDDYDNLGGHVSPRFGLVHQLSKSQTIKLLYGEAYRAPSLGETGILNNSVVVGNPDLDFEMVKAWDLVWMGTWGNAIMSVAGFRNNYKDAIVAGLKGAVRTFVNAGNESSSGITLGAKYFITLDWSVRATYTDFLTLPPTAFREASQLASVESNYAYGAWNWNLLTYHRSARYTLGPNNSRNQLDDYWVFNSKLRYKFKAGYSLSLQAKNLTDLDYFSPAQSIRLPQGVPNRGRELSLILESAF
ncbi:hypothetical protein GCM10011613_07960 [Cellvibrio zantedeschiae]|uniref:TonB-dependent receptor n=1 Tax=Cellvibrio zantedeschiae TaxID=1237077 RepID=A0ABQ3ATN7_9GAMM|nr:TonB-dependent receptor [Cellvibrio zantedeschiae]GGY66440.1 hypothetical protein GCM10011613_07960 [Cellvibrio zantedeschiae]